MMDEQQVIIQDLEFQVLAELAQALRRLGTDPLYYEVGVEELRDSTGHIDRVLNIPASQCLADAINAWTTAMAKDFDWEEYYYHAGEGTF